MKKIIGLVLSLVLVVGGLAACSPQGDKMLSNMKGLDGEKIRNSEMHLEYAINIQNIYETYAKVNEASQEDLSAEDAAKRVEAEKMIEKNPELKIKIEQKSYADISDSKKPFVKADVKIDLEALGLNKTINSEVYVDGQKVFMDTNTLKEVKEAIVYFATESKLLDEKALKEMQESLDKEFVIPDANYILIDNEENMSMQMQMLGLKESDLIQQRDMVFDMFKDMDLSKNISEKDEISTLKLNHEEMFDFMEKAVNLMASQDENIKNQMPDLSSIKTALPMMEGSELTYSNSFMNDVFAEDIDMNIQVMGKSFANIKATTKIMKAEREDIKMPEEKDAYKYEMPKAGSNDLPIIVEDKVQNKAENANPDLKVVFNIQKVNLDDKEAKLLAFNVNGNNYVMLRDLAGALKETDKKFDVSFDKATNKIMLDTTKVYSSDSLPDITVDPINIIVNPYPLYVNEKMSDVKAYNINGNTYFKLRDLASVLEFGIDYDEASKIVIIKTK